MNKDELLRQREKMTIHYMTESELEELAAAGRNKIPALSEYSTTQIKAELRRRKGERYNG